MDFLFQKKGVFRLDPEDLDLDSLELELIDHGLEELGEATGEKQLIPHCQFADFGHLQAAIEAKVITPISAEYEYRSQRPPK